jgi:hypothetical protein
MVTSLIGGAAVPLWDRSLLTSLGEAVFDAIRRPEVRHIAVLNDDGQCYREIVADGSHEFTSIAACLTRRNFDLQIDGYRLLARPTKVPPHFAEHRV